MALAETSAITDNNEDQLAASTSAPVDSLLSDNFIDKLASKLSDKLKLNSSTTSHSLEGNILLEEGAGAMPKLNNIHEIDNCLMCNICYDVVNRRQEISRQILPNL